MILRSLHLQRFGRFRDAAWEFRPGLNVIRGPNEAGKSTMREAIVRLLFDHTKVTTTSRDFLSLRSWGAAQAFALECSFSINGQEFTLSKDFAARSIELRTPDEVLTDDELVAERLHDLLGVSSRAAYESTACVRQAEFAALDAGREVSELLQQTLAGPGAQAGVQEVIDRLNSEISSLQRGLDRPAKRPGQIRRMMDRLAELDEEIERLRPIVMSVEDARKRLEIAEERETEVTSELGEANTLLERVKRRIELQGRLDELTTRCVNLEKTTRQARQLEKNIDELEAQLDRLPDLSEQQVQAVRDLQARVVDAEKALPAEVQRAEELAAEAKAAEEALRTVEADLPDATRVRRAEELERNVAAVEKDLAIAYASASRTDAELAAAERAARNRRIMLIAAAAAVVIGVGMALAASASWAWGLALAGVLAVIYGTLVYRVPSSTDLRQHRAEIKARIQELQTTAQAMGTELETLLGGDDIRALRERLEAGNAALQQARDEAASARAKAASAQDAAERARHGLEVAQARLAKQLADLGFETVDELLAVADEVAAVRDKLANARAELKGLLGDRTIAELDEEFAQLNADRMGLQAELEEPELALAEMDAEEYAGLEKRVDELKREQERLSKEIAEAKAVAERPEADAERLRSLEEQRTATAEQLERLRERFDALQLAHDLLEQAHRETLTSAIEVLEPCSAELLSTLTCGRYEHINFDRATLTPTVYSTEKGDEVDPDRELSCATREQVYLAARLALTRLLWPDVCPPVMLDDPLVNFDPARRQQAVEIIRALASEVQVLLFTCDDTYDDAADHVIVLTLEGE